MTSANTKKSPERGNVRGINSQTPNENKGLAMTNDTNPQTHAAATVNGITPTPKGCATMHPLSASGARGLKNEPATIHLNEFQAEDWRDQSGLDWSLVDPRERSRSANILIPMPDGTKLDAVTVTQLEDEIGAAIDCHDMKAVEVLALGNALQHIATQMMNLPPLEQPDANPRRAIVSKDPAWPLWMRYHDYIGTIYVNDPTPAYTIDYPNGPAIYIGTVHASINGFTIETIDDRYKPYATAATLISDETLERYGSPCQKHGTTCTAYKIAIPASAYARHNQEVAQ